MTSRPKVYLVNPQTQQYEKMFEALGFDRVSNPLAADVLNFQGGADVHASYYGQSLHPKSHCNPVRDANEKRLYDMAVKLNKKTVGICRGGQFLNVMNGGKLWQDIDNHTSSHMAEDVASGRRYWVTSTHHQQMIPADQGEILLIVKNGLCTQKSDDMVTISRDRAGESTANSNMWLDVESVWYPDTKSLCFQPHPEFHFNQGGYHVDVYEVFKSYVNKFILEKAA